MRKQNPSSVSGEQSAKTRAAAHASQEIAPPHAAADARAANDDNKSTTSSTSLATTAVINMLTHYATAAPHHYQFQNAWHGVSCTRPQVQRRASSDLIRLAGIGFDGEHPISSSA